MKAVQAQFEKGELVRFETQDGDRVGEIVTVDGHTLTVEWFGDGKHCKVQRKDAVPFAQFLAQQKRPRKLKTVYAEFFGTHRPARSTVQAGALPLGARVEIDAVALV